MTSMESIPMDIYAIKEIGIEKWQKSYFWPVTDRVYFNLLDELWDNFDEMCTNTSPILNDVLLSDTKFISFIASYLHCHIVKTLCEKEGRKILSNQLSKVYLDPDWDSLSDVNCVPKHKIKRNEFQLRRWAKRVVHNRHLSLFENVLGLFSQSNVWSLGSFSEIKGVYVKKHDLYCDHQYVESIFPRDMSFVNVANINTLEAPIEKFLINLSTYCESLFYFELPVQEIKQCWLKRLTYMMQAYNYIREKKNIPELLLLTEVAKPTHKIIALAVQSRGGEVVGFSHGNDVGNLNRRLQGYIEYSHCNIYICPTERSKKLRQIEYDANKLSNYRKTQFQSIDLKLYKDIFDLNKIEQPVDYVRTVMIIGYPMNTIRYQYSAGDFFYFQLDLELRLATLLKKKGFKVIYKAHPDNIDKIKGIFDEIVDEVLVEPFEQVYQLADAFFFGCLTSTTFGFAVNTNRPIYLFDIEGMQWNSGVYELIQRRCSIIPASFDELNRITFNQNFLIKKLSEKQVPPDYAYVKQFMFPKK